MRTTPTPNSFSAWLGGARPRTLPAAVVPVLVGTFAIRPAVISLGRMALATLVALALQVGTNYANDYSDGVRGTDEDRVGPVRLVGQRLASAGQVRAAALGCFFLAGLGGLWLCALSSWWLLIPGIAAVFAGWFYTGGPRPYGYLGLGEVFVFVFFGLFATVGSGFVQHRQLPSVLWVAALPVGLLATALLEANNLRDIDGDLLANKRTLAVRLGRHRAGWLWVGSIVVAALGVCAVGYQRPLALWGLIGLLPVLGVWKLALSTAAGRALLPMLPATARAQLCCGGLMALGLWIA